MPWWNLRNRRLRSQSEEFWFEARGYFKVLRTERSTSENCIKVHNLIELESKPNSKITRLKMRIVHFSYASYFYGVWRRHDLSSAALIGFSS